MDGFSNRRGHGLTLGESLMDRFAQLPAAEPATVFREAAARSRLGSATIIEKDFWGLLDASESLLESDSAGTSSLKADLAFQGL